MPEGPKRYLVGAEIRPDGSLDTSKAMTWDLDRDQSPEEEQKEQEYVPQIPRGWTYLKHGSNYIKWDTANPRTQDEITLKKALSVVDKEDHERDISVGRQGTSKLYGIVAQPKGMSDEEFAEKNKAFEMRVYFFENHARKKIDPEFKQTLSPQEIEDIKKYYFKNIQYGRHPLVPKGTQLIKLGKSIEDGVEVFYFIPEEYKERYEEDLEKYGTHD